MQDFIRYKWLTLVVFALLIAFSAIALPNVPVNYDIMSYLPESSPSTKAISEMEGAFGALGEETRIMAKVSSIPQALDLKARIENIELAEEVKWLDDVADILQPESFIKQSVLDAWYKDGYALYQARFENGASNKTLLATADELREALGSDVKFSGGELGDAVLKNDAGTQSSQMMLFLLPVVLLIMIFSTRSWLEPLLFIGVIGISILVNMGTNIFMGEISFVSQTTAAALQLAVSM
ncbi:MAG: MMPL family transporter, partial [Clostridiales bacterium]|nr:MMPL family transporter [Clostridiales bacterium]